MEGYLSIVIIFFILENIFQLKHFLADYLLQNEYMLGKFKKEGWIKPLAAHCAVHAVLTSLILLIICPWLSFKLVLGLTFLDFIIHFIIDRIKASPFMLGRFDALNKRELQYYQRSIEVAVAEGAIYDCYNAERTLHKRKKDNKWFWISLGLDQDIHHRTHTLIIFLALLRLVLGLS